MKEPVVVRVGLGKYSRGYKICVPEVYNTYGALVQASGFPFQYALGQQPFESILLEGSIRISDMKIVLDLCKRFRCCGEWNHRHGQMPCGHRKKFLHFES